MPRFGTAQPLKRVEDERLLKGAGQYTDDLQRPGALVGLVLRSPHAAATITRIDAVAARAVPGVVAIYTSDDLQVDGIGDLPCVVPLNNRDGTPRADAPRPLLARGAVRYVGEPVSFIVANSRAAAQDAADVIEISYDMGTAITDTAVAVSETAPRVWAGVPHNVVFDWDVGDRAAVDALFANAAHITKIRIINNRVVVNSLEPRAAVGEYDASTGRWTLTTNTQGGWFIKDVLSSAVFREPADRFRVVTPDVGGGFGMKLFVYPEQALVCYAARKLGCPVKWTSERGEAFLSDTQGRDHVTEAELALDANNKILAMRVDDIANMGAYLSNFAPFIPTMAGSRVLASVYQFQAVYARVRGVFTNTVPVDAYRGAGRPESNYLVERLIAAAARERGIDQAEFRRLNMIPASAMPFRSAMSELYDSGDFQRVLDRAMNLVDWIGFPKRRRAAETRGKLRGLGLAYYLEVTMGDPSERAEIRFARDGSVDVFVGTQSTGQGHATAYVQLTAGELGISPEKIRIQQGDTDVIPTGGGTGGSRSLYSESQAILLTAASIVEKGKREAADLLEAAVNDIIFEDGSFKIIGTDRQIDILTLASRLHRDSGNILDTAEIAQIDDHTYPNGCHVAEVEVDPETGAVKVERYLVCDDMGTVMNPMIVRGQIHGGVAQGLGQAFLEHTAYDPETGQLVSGSLMDYALPRADNLPEIEVELVPIPCTKNPLGVKGAGEAGAVGSPPALMNALIDALSARGITEIDMPATPERIWSALHRSHRAA